MQQIGRYIFCAYSPSISLFIFSLTHRFVIRVTFLTIRLKLACFAKLLLERFFLFRCQRPAGIRSPLPFYISPSFTYAIGEQVVETPLSTPCMGQGTKVGIGSAAAKQEYLHQRLQQQHIYTMYISSQNNEQVIMSIC